MPRVPRQPKFQTDTGRISADTLQKKQGAGKAKKVQAPAKADEVDQVDSSTSAERPDGGSPLTDAVWKGLTQVAQTYYGDTDAGAADGLKVLLNRAPNSHQADVNKVVSKELRDLKAAQLSRDLGLDRKSAQELVDNLAIVLLTPN